MGSAATANTKISSLGLFLFVFCGIFCSSYGLRQESRTWLSVFPCGVCSCTKRSSNTTEIGEISMNCSSRNLKALPTDFADVFLNSSFVLKIDLSMNPLLSESISLSDQEDQNFCQTFPDIEDLSLAFDGFEEVPIFLKGCSKLQVLNLTGNWISSVSADQWRGLHSLRELHGLGVTSRLSVSALAPLAGLEELELTFTGRRLGAGLVAGNHALRRLSLTATKVSRLPGSLFDNGNEAQGIRVLTVNGPLVRVLSPGIWAGLDNVTSLDLWLPQLRSLDARLPSHIQRLSVRAVHQLTTDLSGLHNLVSLTLTQSRDVTRLVLPTSASLRALEVSGCSMTSVPRGWWPSLSDLRSLNLHNNEIDTLTSLPEMTNLTDLDLSRNFLSALTPGSLTGLPGLTSLNLSRNTLEAVTPGSLSTLPALTRLDLSWNYIKEWNPGPLASLQVLDLSGNLLTDLMWSESGRSSELRSVDLSENELSDFPPDVLGLANVRVVSLGSNPLTSVPGREICHHVTSLSELGLEATLLHCDCRVTALARCREKLQVRGHCAGPSDVSGQAVGQLQACVVTTIPPTTTTATTTTTTTTRRQDILIQAFSRKEGFEPPSRGDNRPAQAHQATSLSRPAKNPSASRSQPVATSRKQNISLTGSGNSNTSIPPLVAGKNVQQAVTPTVLFLSPLPVKHTVQQSTTFHLMSPPVLTIVLVLLATVGVTGVLALSVWAVRRRLTTGHGEISCGSEDGGLGSEKDRWAVAGPGDEMSRPAGLQESSV
ncbi:leucine-rich repeat-containing G-protein coupled receptor 4 [Aplysia californica]|uniref:Leucine-rich repeat-containing G-protein coupled receptor 4 n=1 Tax=Aplysia californica TaxID=6500 RepID=A0ABM0K5U4_APLCA|nr:leucine-rich repeat-containing G-protein coupled receptor 4 [Aplysia californica]